VATWAFRRITAIMAAKGGLVADITAGDCLEALHLVNSMFDRTSDRNPYFHQLMHATGAFPQVPRRACARPCRPGSSRPGR
jgi:hypothetical protein